MTEWRDWGFMKKQLLREIGDLVRSGKVEALVAKLRSTLITPKIR